MDRKVETVGGFGTRYVYKDVYCAHMDGVI